MFCNSKTDGPMYKTVFPLSTIAIVHVLFSICLFISLSFFGRYSSAQLFYDVSVCGVEELDSDYEDNDLGIL